MSSPAGCLEGVRVLELARYQAGPRAGMLLADLGAEVIKVERPGGEETRHHPPRVRGQSVYFSVYNRSKKSVVIDLRKRDGLRIFKDLVATSDVVLENFRPGTIDRMGLGFDELKKIKGNIILVSVSGYGQTGPNRDRPAYDNVGQALSGLMHLTGLPEGHPVMTAFSLVDRTTALHATIGTLAALAYRDRTGEGQWVDVCLMDSGYTMVEIPMSYYLSTGDETGGVGRRPYQASNGWLSIAAISSEITKRMAKVAGLPEDAPAGASALDSHPASKVLAAWCRERTVSEIIDTLEPIGVVVIPIRTIPQAAADPHLREREMLVKVPDSEAGEIYVPGLSIKFSSAPGSVGPVPRAGQDSTAILEGLPGYSPDRVAALIAAGVVEAPAEVERDSVR